MPNFGQNAEYRKNQINAERDRRVEQGTTLPLGVERSVPISGNLTTQINLFALAFGATLRALMSDPEFVARLNDSLRNTSYRDGNNDIHLLTDAELIQLWSQGAEFISDIFQKSWSLKDQGKIPVNVDDDAKWL